MATTLCFFIVLFLLATVSRAHVRPPWLRYPICSTTSATCGFTAQDAQRRFLSSYTELKKRLRLIKLLSRHPIHAGPLIQNGGNLGILDIDVPIDSDLGTTVKLDVCGAANPTPTIRQAVICSVTESSISTRGNKEASKVGRSTQGREILAVRVGRRGAPKVMISTQQHGHEAASTESALQLLFQITRRYRSPLLRQLDMLFVLRANPDGGEPDSPLTDIPPAGTPSGDRPLFYRYNVDKTAGMAPTESDFFGSVNQGYDLNRYHYVGLNNAVRPVEAQAIVSAILAFRPDVLFDIHDDSSKSVCEIDLTSVTPPTQALPFPLAKCIADIGVPTVLTNRSSMIVGSFFGDDASILTSPQFTSLQSGLEFVQRKLLTRNIIATAAGAVDPVVDGRIGRFSVPGFGVDSTNVGSIGSFSEGTMDRGAMAIGAVGTGIEVLIFKPPVRPVLTAVRADETEAQGIVAIGIEPCFLYDAICLHRQLLASSLVATAKLVKKPLTNEGGFCNLPTSNGQIFEVLSDSGFPLELVTNGPALIPFGFVGAPTQISGRCPNDPPELQSSM